MTDEIKVEVRIIHPTEGAISKEYSLDEFPDVEVMSGFVTTGAQDWLKGIICAKKCTSKKGFVACVARCMITGEACDGGVDNCS